MGRGKRLEISVRFTGEDPEAIEYNAKLNKLVSIYNKKRVLSRFDNSFIEVAAELEQHIKSGNRFGLTFHKIKKNEGFGKVSDISGALTVGRRQLKILGKKPGGGPGPGPSFRP